ncbi:pyruvate ferredoxin oxidoreductase [Candidatus Falkowbacteria bacterium HGW-Falkowbacteria-1]|jgi:pyruvate ferredoxin oxidoreductase alpha subunit|uniref:Pyruvate ferredoxin oxidoreductase n=1 Tax=Candidatus Falkowbacteria bacterium HGW-Falkowbacteria-1 TaxID=2013768 RepID=A0A2N2E8R0_9BACT|nr:MAG: pyruvate ferredoxin oxidoreductase [Candidatus Falkowbacteria bacterium HGW-Falkowbacteria-1]
MANKKSQESQGSQILEGSHAIALTIKNINPDVVSAYPITPQTHIVEDLAKIKANGEADYEYVRAESEFAAASIVLGASAAGSRVYSATSSQGLLLMTEVIYNISGLRLPIVMTLANRAISAPINIWNDQQDAMAIKDAGWIMFFAENNQEAIEQHVLAYKIAEKMMIPVFVNVDGFILTHCYEPIKIPQKKEIDKFLPKYKAKKGEFLDPTNPVTIGAFMTPAHYQQSREDLHIDFTKSIKEIDKEYFLLQNILNNKIKNKKTNNGLFEYSGPVKPKTIIVAMGSVIGTIKSALKNNKQVGILKIKTYRPFPHQEIYDIMKEAKNIIVLEKALSFGTLGPLYSDLSIFNKKQKIKNFIAGLGGKDIKEKDIIKITQKFDNYDKLSFI